MYFIGFKIDCIHKIILLNSLFCILQVNSQHIIDVDAKLIISQIDCIKPLKPLYFSNDHLFCTCNSQKDFTKSILILFEIKKSRFFNIAEFQKESILTFMSDSFYLIHSTPNTFFTFSNSKIYKIDLNTLKSNPINLIVPDSLKNAKIVGVANGSINIYIEKKDVNFSLELSDNKITKIEFNKRFDDKIEWIHIDYKLLSYGTTFNKKSKQVPVIGYKNKAFKVIGNTEGQIIGINAQNQVLGNWFNSMTQVPGVFVFDLKSQPKGAEFPVWTDLFPDVPSYLTSVNYEFVIGSKFNEPFIYSNKKVFLLNELLKSTKLPLSKITKVMKVSHSGVIFCEAINLSGAIGYYIIFKLVN